MAKKQLSKKHLHSWDYSGTITCGCVYKDGYILVTPEEQENENWQNSIKDLTQ